MSFYCQIRGHLLCCGREHMLLLGAMMTFLCFVLLASLSHCPCSSFPFSAFTFALLITCVYYGNVRCQFCDLTGRRWEGSSSSSPSVFTSPVASPESGMLSVFGLSSPTSVCLAPTGTCVSAPRPSDRGPLLAWLGCACPVDAFLEGARDPRSCRPRSGPSTVS